jgi:epoxyqueuosine reductase
MLASEDVKALAAEAGFDLCGIAPAAAHRELRLFREWLQRGYAGTMGYLSRTAARREDARHVLPSARSVIVTATVYNVERPYSTESEDPGVAVISRHAWGDDYHGVISRRLEALIDAMRERDGSPFEARAYVDTGPVQERVYAQYGGIGWVGKNTCLISPSHGSWLFLSEILCSLSLEPDPPAFDRCGACSLCLEACPTGALVEPRVLDATRCLSYLTIELKGPVPEELRRPVGRHVHGCDVCQEVCPWNQQPATSAASEWQPRPGLDRPRLAGLWRRADHDLAGLVSGSAMTRPGLVGLRRNLAVALGNSVDPDANAALDAVVPAAPSTEDPLVVDHVRWARRQARGRGR